MVFQHFGLFPWKRLHQNVAYGLHVQKMTKAEIKERVDHYIDMVGLRGFENHFPYQLSGGMQERWWSVASIFLEPRM